MACVCRLRRVKSSATTVKEYLASLPADRRAGVEAVRKVILKNLDKDYEESMLWGMIGYAVPHRVWPLGYHCDPKKPLMMAALANQKDNITVYLMSVYSSKSERAWFEQAWAKTGKRLNMGELRPLQEGRGRRARCDRRGSAATGRKTATRSRAPSASPWTPRRRPGR